MRQLPHFSSTLSFEASGRNTLPPMIQDQSFSRVPFVRSPPLTLFLNRRKKPVICLSYQVVAVVGDFRSPGRILLVGCNDVAGGENDLSLTPP